MNFSSLVVVVLRLFGLYWFAAFAIGLVGSLGLVNFSATSGLSGMSKFLPLLVLLTPSVYLVLGILVWVFARKIALLVSGDVDFKMGSPNFVREDLYATGLLVLGVYFFLSHLGRSLNWLYYLAVNKAGDELLYGGGTVSFYDVFSQVIPCAAGLYFAIFCRRFGRRLSRKDATAE